MITDGGLINACIARGTFSIFANAFRQRGMDVVGQGWSGTKNKLEIFLKDPAKKLETRKNLEEIYLDNLLYANKAVYLWAIGREEAGSLVAALPAAVDKSSVYVTHYPYPIEDSALKTASSKDGPTAIHIGDGFSTVIFASKRTITEEEIFSDDKIPKELREAGYTQLYGKKVRMRPVFDSFTITPELGLVELRIDLGKYLSEKEIYQYRLSLVNRLNAVAKQFSISDRLLSDARNLAGALAPLYRGQSWTVNHIAHVNEGGYINNNKGRYRNHDVRKDLYHSNGETAVQNLQLWSVSATFKSPFGSSQPTLMLEGRSKMLNSETPFMDLCRIVDCSCKADYDLVLDTLLKCLPAE